MVRFCIVDTLPNDTCKHIKFRHFTKGMLVENNLKVMEWDDYYIVEDTENLCKNPIAWVNKNDRELKIFNKKFISYLFRNHDDSSTEPVTEMVIAAKTIEEFCHKNPYIICRDFSNDLDLPLPVKTYEPGQSSEFDYLRVISNKHDRGVLFEFMGFDRYVAFMCLRKRSIERLHESKNK